MRGEDNKTKRECCMGSDCGQSRTRLFARGNNARSHQEMSVRIGETRTTGVWELRRGITRNLFRIMIRPEWTLSGGENPRKQSVKKLPLTCEEKTEHTYLARATEVAWGKKKLPN